MKTAIQLGISLSDYEEMTPYELMIAIEAYSEKALSEMEEKLTLVWLGEYYHRQKYLPQLKDVLKMLQPNSTKKMSDDEMLKMVKQLNAQFGGTIVKGEIDESTREENTPDSL